MELEWSSNSREMRANWFRCETSLKMSPRVGLFLSNSSQTRNPLAKVDGLRQELSRVSLSSLWLVLITN